MELERIHIIIPYSSFPSSVTLQLLFLFYGILLIQSQLSSTTTTTTDLIDQQQLDNEQMLLLEGFKSEEEDEGGTLLKRELAKFEHIFKPVEEEGEEEMEGHQLLVEKERYALGYHTLPLNGVKTQTMPCCAGESNYQSIGGHVCNELRNRRPLVFRRRCKMDADFAILQCCFTCRTNVTEMGRELFADGLKSRHCFDRHNRHFCSHFIHQSGMWAANAGKAVKCNGDNAALAFRVCRRSCGFCDPELYQMPNRNCSSRTSPVRYKGNGLTATTVWTTLDGGRWKNKGSEKNTKTTSSIPGSQNGGSATSTTTTPAASTPTSTSNEYYPQENNHCQVPTPHPSPPPAGSSPAPATLHPTRLPPTSPRLRPCTVPPLPPLPTIPPCPPPVAPLKPLTPATISPPPPPRPTLPPPVGTVRPPYRPAPPSPPFPPPYPPLPPLPLPPIRPIGPTGRKPVPTSITITWRPVPGSGTWPEWPIPLPDEVIESILNKLSGIDKSGFTIGKCRECERAEDEEENGEEQQAGEEQNHRR